MTLRTRFEREVSQAGLPIGLKQAVVTEAAVDGLPEPVRRYMNFMGVIGRPRDWSLRAHLTGHFKPSPTLPWMPMVSWQYNNAIDVARFSHLRIMFYGVLPVYARDVYLHGSARMQGKALNLATVVDEKGPELALGELVTYLNDAILMAPSMLLHSDTKWHGLGADAFEVVLRDSGMEVRAEVTLDSRGAPLNFVTQDRFIQDPYQPEHPFVRARWSTPVDGWQTVNGRALPTTATAKWHLQQGEFAYAKALFEPGGVMFNVGPCGEADEATTATTGTTSRNSTPAGADERVLHKHGS